MAVRASKLRSTKLCYVLPSQSLYSLFTQVVSSIVRCDWLTRGGQAAAAAVGLLDGNEARVD